MENLFYECEIANKFDLKGSDRNRLVDPTNQNGEIVLLDENLIQSTGLECFAVTYLILFRCFQCRGQNRFTFFLTVKRF